MSRVRQLIRRGGGGRDGDSAGAGQNGAGQNGAGRAGARSGGYLIPGKPLLGSQELTSSLFADASNFEVRFVESYDQIETIVGALKTLGLRVVLTSGSFDIIHEGHSMYLEAARRFGDFLIVGLDSDEKIQSRKGPDRPAVPQMERLRMVTHQRGVGLVTLKEARHPRWELIKTVGPDVLVATEDTYSAAEIAELESRYCTRVEVLERMATVSTSARLRRIQLGIPEPEASGAALADGSPGEPALGEAEPGEPALGEPALGEAEPAEPALAEPALGEAEPGNELSPAGRPGN